MRSRSMFLSKKETCAFFFKRLLVRVLSFPEQRKEELIFLSKISNIYLPLSLEEIALREREREIFSRAKERRERRFWRRFARARERAVQKRYAGRGGRRFFKTRCLSVRG
jgi:hypothetical protein